MSVEAWIWGLLAVTAAAGSLGVALVNRKTAVGTWFLFLAMASLGIAFDVMTYRYRDPTIGVGLLVFAVFAAVVDSIRTGTDEEEGHGGQP